MFRKDGERRRTRVDILKERFQPGPKADVHPAKGVEGKQGKRTSARRNRLSHRQSSARRSTLRGRNWLKFQLDKRRYQIGFPIGWGSFSVVYFARAHRFLDNESKRLKDVQPFQTLGAPIQEQQQALNKRRSSLDVIDYGKRPEEVKREMDKDLPEFVAVKVIKVKELNETEDAVKIKRNLPFLPMKTNDLKRKETLSAVRELRLPNEDVEKMFQVNLPVNKTGKQLAAQKDDRKRLFDKYTTSAEEAPVGDRLTQQAEETSTADQSGPEKNPRRRTVFDRLGRVFDMELNSFLARKFNQHFDPRVLDEPSPAAMSSSGEPDDASITLSALEDGNETDISDVFPVEEVEEILEVGPQGFNDSPDMKGNSWIDSQLPNFFMDKFKSSIRDSTVSSRKIAQANDQSESLLTLPEDGTLSNAESTDFESIHRESIVEFPSLTSDNFEMHPPPQPSMLPQSPLNKLKKAEQGPSEMYSGDSKFAFLSRIMRKKKSAKQSNVLDMAAPDYISNLKRRADIMLTNQIRNQVQSIMTEMVVDNRENASDLEHSSILDDAVKHNLVSEKDKEEFLGFKKEQDKLKDLEKQHQLRRLSKQKLEFDAFKGKETRKPKQSRTALKEKPNIRNAQKSEDISREIRALRKMRDCQFSIYLFDVVQAPKEIWLVMEFAHIGCLATFCEASYPAGVPDKIAKWLMTPILLAINHLHNHNMIHRDIKPGNVVLTHAGVPKLCDYGMVKELDSQHSPILKAGGFCGTEVYAPPEAFGKERYYSTNFDSWSFGISLLSLLYGQANPWEHNYGRKPRNIGKMNAVTRRKKCIDYIAGGIESEVRWINARKEVMALSSEMKQGSQQAGPDEKRRTRRGMDKSVISVEYVGLHKRLSLLEKRDIKNPDIEEVLMLMLYRDLKLTMVRKKKRLKSNSTMSSSLKENEAEQKLKVLQNLVDSGFSKLKHGKQLGVKIEELRERLKKGTSEFTPDRRKIIKFVKKCLVIYEDRPTANELLKDRYLSKMVRSWERFDPNMESKLMEVAVTGEFSCFAKANFAGPYFNIRGEFIDAAKEVAMKVHRRFTTS